jgi:hypothetical protein
VADASEARAGNSENSSVGATRRQFVQRAAVAGGLFVWATPTVRSVTLAKARLGSPPPRTTTALETGTTAPETTTTSPETTTTAEPPPGCTHSQGYWKNHADPDGDYDPTWDAVGGPDAEFFDTGDTYLAMLHTSPRGNAFVILAHQWIAAELNIAAGAAVSPAVQPAFAEATQLLQTWSATGLIPKSHDDRPRALECADLLDQYNNGNAGTPHCPD